MAQKSHWQEKLLDLWTDVRHRPPLLWGGAVALIIVVALSVYVVSRANRHKLPQMQAVPVEMVRVKKGPIGRLHNTNGVLTAVKSVQLFPEIDGRVAEVLFQQGAAVKKGDVLVRLDGRLARAKVQEAEARLQHAKSEFESAKSLFQKKFLARVAFDQKKSELSVAEAGLSVAEVNLSQTEIAAPFEGVVGLSEVTEGSMINRQQPVTTLLVLDPLYVDFSIPDSLLGALSQDVPVDVMLEGGLPMEAAIIAVDTQSSAGTHSVRIRAELRNQKGKMRPGQFVAVAVYLGKESEALLIPSKALLQEGERQYVYVVIDGIAVRREVTTGLREGGFVQVKEGLSDKEMVITVGQVNVQDGSLVKEADQEPSQAGQDGETV